MQTVVDKVTAYSDLGKLKAWQNSGGMGSSRPFQGRNNMILLAYEYDILR